jgi:hypothetical protein
MKFFTNHFYILKVIKQHTKKFFGVWELAFITFCAFFFEFLTPFILGGWNFFNSIPFFMIFCGSECANRKGSSFVWTLETTEPSPWIWPTLNA